jgi:DNA sulfur modification protein DndB
MAVLIDDVLKVDSGGRVSYSGWIRAAEIYESVFVPVTVSSKKPRAAKSFVEALEERPGGYQRNASRGRQLEIARFMIKTPQSIIPPVLLSERNGWKWEGASKSSPLGRIVVENKAAVVDGQHRLGGLRLQSVMPEGDPNLLVPFIAVVGLSEKREQEEFLTINNSQKGVSKAHAAFLEQDKWFNNVALSLNDDGVFAGRIQAAGGVREPWHLDWKLHSIANEIKRVFSSDRDGDLWGFGDDDTLRAEELPQQIGRYWELIADVFPEEWSDLEKLPEQFESFEKGKHGTTKDFLNKLLELTGYLAMMTFLKKVAPAVWDRESRTLNEQRLLEYLTWISEAEEKNPKFGMPGEDEMRKVVDWRKLGKFEGRTGAAGARPLVEAMVGVVSHESARQGR